MTDFRFSGRRKTNGPSIHALTSNPLENVCPNYNSFRFNMAIYVPVFNKV